MWFWRKKSFQALTEAASFASAFPDWLEYARYCELFEKGLRKDALNHLSVFIEASAKWSFVEKKKFVSWLYHFAYEDPEAYLLMPYPLSQNLLEPTLAEWAEAEPEEAEPYRWLGTYEHLKRALELDPNDEIAIYRFAMKILNGVSYSTHELPYGYLGNPQEDLSALAEAEEHIKRISDEEKKSNYRDWISEEREIINNHLKRSSEA